MGIFTTIIEGIIGLGCGIVAICVMILGGMILGGITGVILSVAFPSLNNIPIINLFWICTIAWWVLFVGYFYENVKKGIELGREQSQS